MKSKENFKRNLGKAMRTVGVAAMLLAAMIAASDAVQSVRRVRIELGKTKVTFSGEVGTGGKQTYVVRLKKGDNLEIDVER